MTAGKAVSLADFIKTDRERKKNEALAQKVFGKGRRNSAPGAAASGGNRRAGAGPSLASRVGVQKQRSASTAFPKQRGKPAGNVDVEWTHDLHSLNNLSASRVSQLPHQKSRGGRAQARNGQRMLAALNGAVLSPAENTQFNIVQPKSTVGMNIRGLAGPYTLVAKNFAPGTSAADIESAMTPVGGEIRTCKIVSTNPVTAEIVFESKEGADMVIETFHGQTADGRRLSVFYKPTSLSPSTKQPAAPVTERFRSGNEAHPSPPTGPRAENNSRSRNDHYQPRERSRERRRSYDQDQDQVMDGSYGFPEKMDIDDDDGRGQGQGLYSDNLVKSHGTGRGRYNSRDGERGRDRGQRYRR